ncbi:MAG: polyphosphate kinase 1 [Psychroflexus halocasei]|uniref:polyphosphate kinase 1 n=1 Tax=Psychroflexus sp. S27 TaxID=1982757 RepID=UPI000C29AEAE|nr:polyphosphate kinase 1 [Psychroflexus sp. S27]PJX23964.1 polyphosphate kinase 1 [Psychroflexus sp. S27]
MAEKKFINREISWLHFNARVLQEAADKSVPLIERLRFLGIFSNNLDEFFKVRYATVKRINQAGKSGKKALGGFKAGKLLNEITEIVIERQAESLRILSEIRQELKKQKISIINENEVEDYQIKFIKDYFLQKVSPALVTIMLNAVETVPHLKDSKAYLAVKMKEKVQGEIINKYILIEIPTNISRFVELPSQNDQKYIMLIDDLIRYNLDVIFNIFDYQSISAHMVKITRDASLEMERDLNKSYFKKIIDSVKDRIDGDPVRFVYDEEIEQDTLDFLLQKMGIDNTDSLIPGGRYHNRRDYMAFPDLGAKHLLYDKIEALPVKGLNMQGSLLSKLKHKDFIQFTPYHTFSYTVKFLREAALDPKVKAIKITIYRLAEVSHIASSLINAAKNGKKVTVSIELQARFDEVNNIKYAEKMEREGVKLIFGVVGLKVHAKTCVIDRLEDKKVRKYGFISTGNFNEITAKVYTDYTLFTSHQGILKDIKKVFDFFEVNYKIKKYKHLIVSPHYSRERFIELIDQEIDNHKAGLKSRIRLKMNSFSDYKMIEKLYEASQAGVKIDLIVRGICCLRAQVEGLSENIHVISIVDKFLEHTRLFYFENAGDSKVFISSADWMTRNLDNRVEVTCPIYDEDIKAELMDTFDISWSDNVKARDITNASPLNEYRRQGGKAIRSQFEIYNYYLKKLEE